MGAAQRLKSEETDLLSDAAVAQMRAQPRFREAAEAHAAAALAAYEAEDATTRWMIKDLGRTSLCVAAMILDGWPGGVTVTNLMITAAASGAASRGRVLAFVHYAQARGRIVATSGPEPWIHRRLTLTPAFVEPHGRRTRGGFKAALIVAPEIAPAEPKLQSEAGIRIALAAAGTLLTSRPQLSHNQGGALRDIFVARDGGMRVLQHLLLSQRADRSHLLEEATLSRANLARRYGVSRTHINRMLADAQAAGALRLAALDRVVFTPGFSAEMEAFVAGQIQMIRVLARAVMDAPLP